MSQQVNIQESLVVNPSSIDTEQSSYSTGSGNANAYDGIDSTTYSSLSLNSGSGVSSYVTYRFDVSELPANATLDSIECKAKARISSTSYIATATLQLYSNTTAKGSTTSFRSTSTSTIYTLTPGTWTKAELANIRIRATATRGTSNTSRSAYIYFYGADLTINYTISGTQYTLTAVSEVDEVSVDPLAVNVLEGRDTTFTIDLGNVALEDIVVKDNDIDVTEELVQHEIVTGGTISAVPASYTTSGSISGTRYQSTVGHGIDNPSSQTGSDYCNSNGSTATIYYRFDFDDIPDNATIESMTVQAYGHLESTSQSSEVARLNTYYGTTAKGTQISYTSTSNQTLTITPGNWTVAELKDDARVGFTIGYYGGLTTGITWTVTYSVPSSGSQYYYTYTLTSMAADHEIVIERAGAFVPPEEDPEKTYYPITISSINATTNPHNGTTRVEAGTTETITISPTDPQLTLALDNGVDITSQLVGGTPTNTYEVDTQATGASYGFSLNSSTGYYVSTNNGVAKSASVARINMDFESDCLVTITYINYAEEDYDYGMFGKLDTAVATDGLTAASGGSSPSDSTSNYQLAKCSNSSGTQTITYQVSAGEHFIDVKYGKDDGTNSNNDSLQWKITSVEATSAGGDYTYTLTNITQKHSLIFIFGNVNYFFITSSGTNSKLYPDGQVVKLEGDSYQLRIVPDDPQATVTLLDNNVNRTSVLEYESGQDKYGNTVVNYTYKLTNITAAHTITVTCTSAASAKIYLKVNGSWVEYSKVYVKTNGSWVEQDPSTWTSLFDTRTNYRKGN